MSFKPKLIALDMDGTLLDNKSRLSARNKKALQEAMRQGISVVIATGRMYPSALPVVKEIGTDSPCVFYNGALVRNPHTGETMYSRGLGVEMTGEVVDYYRSKNWYIQIYSEDRLYVVDESDPRAEFYTGIAKVPAVPLGDKFWSFRTDSTKLLGIALDAGEFKNMRDKTIGAFGGRLYIASSWGAFVEMAHPDVNKARGVGIAAKSLGIDPCDVLAFGDAGNDKEMLAWAGRGVAMKEAPDSVKAAADEIAESNDEDGVALVVEKYL